MRFRGLDWVREHREARAALLLILVLTFGAMKEPRLIEAGSINSILLWIPLLTVMAVGQMLVIVTKGIDVSVGSTLGFAGIAVGMLFRYHPELNVALGAAIGIAIGAGLGLFNGLLIAKVKIPPIITTLGTLSGFRGLTFILSKGEQVDSSMIPSALTAWSSEGPIHLGRVTIPWLLVIAFVVAGLGWVFAAKMVAGRDLYAVGSNAEAAHMHGVRVSRALITAYTVCGALAGLAGVMYASRYGSVNPGAAGQGFELTVIAATVIGGADVRGGSGTVLGVVLGCMLLGVINVALAVVGIAADWQLLVYGFVILIALTLDAVLGRRVPVAA